MKLFTTLLGFSFAVFSISGHSALIQSYSFSGNALDETGSNHGSVNGATLTTDRFGNANSAYSFTASNSIQANLVDSDSMSFSVWASSNSFSSNPMLFNTGSYGSGPDLFVIPDYCDSIAWNTWDSCGNNFGSGATALNLDDGDFHHYVLTNDSINSIATLYIDGILFGTAGYRETGTTLTIGSSWDGHSYYDWNGSIDDINIYDTSLSQSEVNALYSGTVPEPSILALMGLGLAGLGVTARRKKLLKA